MDEKASAAIRAVEERVLALEHANRETNIKLDENTTLTTAVKKDTAVLVEFAKAAQGIAAVGRVVAAIGRFCGRVIAWVAKYILPFVIAGAAVWAVLRGKNPS